MGRRRSIDAEQIVRATLVVLSTHGVEAVTISQIARQAGISEASIYKFFTSKDDLLRACVSESLEPQDFWRRLFARGETWSVSALLEEAALYTIDYYQQHLPTLLLRVLRPQAGDCCSAPLQTLKLQAHYFQLEMDRGRIRRGDPYRLAMAFCGPLFYHVFAAQAYFQSQPPIASEPFARAWAQDFYQSIRPTD
ncbi:TetR/AcrR family transcriptional regulator [Gloeobacter kilaueensis]|uniref:TetR family transcriptional regulator n=1 Tax=Gloeobacter kilaueensis (strain ATCC BAA-2537 / CCAP 1431/1 / ULC 316 / JS1) TaxID=1183438 RepID=U5QJK0_GLOK1|nr:TetR/AcrR family transcriptional regulator [Gloeobacter kilaueensis]AGY57815.1 TetR family transcriptional regulator [Gloeobacter kilaueensis JS1]